MREFKPLKPSQKIRVAVANGCKTAKKYAHYVQRIRGERVRNIAEIQGGLSDYK